MKFYVILIIWYQSIHVVPFIDDFHFLISEPAIAVGFVCGSFIFIIIILCVCMCVCVRVCVCVFRFKQCPTTDIPPWYVLSCLWDRAYTIFLAVSFLGWAVTKRPDKRLVGNGFKPWCRFTPRAYF